jgi:integrative and conjugative element protein (TIGR02256 family)
MHQFVQTNKEAPESGGTLIGRYISGTDDVVVDEITVPLPSDDQTRHTFLRTQASHQQKIERAWEDSGNTQTYLGEWHTHPEAVPVPSELDQATWIKKLFRDRFGESLFFLIVGTERIRAWEGRPGTGVKKLTGKDQSPLLQ